MCVCDLKKLRFPNFFQPHILNKWQSTGFYRNKANHCNLEPHSYCLSAAHLSLDSAPASKCCCCCCCWSGCLVTMFSSPVFHAVCAVNNTFQRSRQSSSNHSSRCAYWIWQNTFPLANVIAKRFSLLRAEWVSRGKLCE